VACEHVTRQRHVNNNRGMVFSAPAVPMAAHATMEYGMPQLRNNRTATEERCFLRGLCRDVISRAVSKLEDCCGTVVVSCC
jgi:hypothetical protein